jgi:hypothetical protein
MPRWLVLWSGKGLPHHALRLVSLANPGRNGGAAAWPVIFNRLKSFAINLLGG